MFEIELEGGDKIELSSFSLNTGSGPDPSAAGGEIRLHIQEGTFVSAAGNRASTKSTNIPLNDADAEAFDAFLSGVLARDNNDQKLLR